MLSVFDMFKIGIGPSSSHTFGPMIAAGRFVKQLTELALFEKTVRVTVDLYGSLALTGKGHGTIEAVLSGLEGHEPKSVDVDQMLPRAGQLMHDDDLLLAGQQKISFVFARDIHLHKHQFLPRHANGMKLSAFDAQGEILFRETYYSIGGGFVVTEAEFDHPSVEHSTPPYSFKSAVELLRHCEREGKTIAQIVMQNEAHWQPEVEVRRHVLEIVSVMQACVENGCRREGELPGGYGVKRRAPNIFRKMVSTQLTGRVDVSLWVMLYAFAVSEENAVGGRIVTAPTNGAAGIIPAVLSYYRNFHPQANEQGMIDFILTAAAIGMLYKMNASISGAEVGCQGEVGVACSMAAGAYCAVIGGTLSQVENAAEIGMEHNLGLTCDPVGGLVQIPCVERNGVAAERAIKCAQLACMEDGNHRVSLDQVIETMYRTGLDMQNNYKETSLGGLAVTVGLAAC